MSERMNFASPLAAMWSLSLFVLLPALGAIGLFWATVAWERWLDESPTPAPQPIHSD
jgi:hypothetical protein